MNASSRLFFVILLSMIAPLAAAAQPTFQPGRGISMDQWVTWPATDTWGDRSIYNRFPEWMHFVDDGELIQLRRAGIDTIRLPIEPAFLMYNDDPERRGVIMAGIKVAIDRLIALDFKVIADLHTISRRESDAAGINDILANQTIFDNYRKTLAFLAGQLRHYYPGKLALEIINEPSLDCNDRQEQDEWQEAAERLFAAARGADPNRTLIVTGACWGSANGLAAMQPAAFDPNTIWTFHTYEPFAITHQGARWTGDLTAHLRDIPYPPYAAANQSVDAIINSNIRNIRENTSGTAARHAIGMVRGNLTDSTTPEKLEAYIREPFETAARWADAKGIAREAIFVGEFGMIGREWQSDLEIDPQWRVAYMRDIIAIAEDYGFSWSVWSFGGAFGLMQGFGGEPLNPTLIDEILPGPVN
ncbi:MAG: cellulase family glycosylhydrolase [Pseudomonadota bacterium]